MATTVVRNMLAKDASAEDIMATVLCTLAASTALLGIALIITGKCKLASLVQYLPLPVIGGYLAYIGLYCGLAGLGLMAGADVQHPQVKQGLEVIVKTLLSRLIAREFNFPANSSH
eukprot:1175867-Prorocentrum_minimum.AAC.2